MKRRRLLFISTRFLIPADGGGKIRSRDILRRLKGGRFDVTLMSPAAPGASQLFAGELGRLCDRFVSWPEAKRGMLWTIKRGASVVSGIPVAVSSDSSEVGRRTVALELERRPDVVVADFAHSTILLPQHVTSASVLFTHNVESEIFQRQAEVAANSAHRALWKSQERKMRRFESSAARRFDLVLAVSDRDAEHFRTLCGRDRVVVVPTAVDLDYFKYRIRNNAPSGGGTLVFTGSMNWLPNIDGIRFLMDEVWPRIVSKRPDAKVVVVGHSPPKALVQAARNRRLAWSFTGLVDDVRPYCDGADLYVIPLRVGGGTRIKVYEAMAMGCPVVSTTLGIAGLPLVSGHDCLIADTADSFANAVLQMLDDVTSRRVIAENARRLVEQNFSADTAAAVFEDACWRAVTLAEARNVKAAQAPIGTSSTSASIASSVGVEQ